jgi:fatty-acyl-CoA synthase
VKVVDAFPLTYTGKVRKFEMRERSILELGLQQEAATATA